MLPCALCFCCANNSCMEDGSKLSKIADVVDKWVQCDSFSGSYCLMILILKVYHLFGIVRIKQTLTRPLVQKMLRFIWKMCVLPSLPGRPANWYSGIHTQESHPLGSLLGKFLVTTKFKFRLANSNSKFKILFHRWYFRWCFLFSKTFEINLVIY